MRQTLYKLLLPSVLLLLLAAQPAFADNVYATIRGTVTDNTGAVVPGAEITATNTNTGASKTATSQSTGHFEFLQLPIGTYTVTITKAGFKSFKSSGITLTVNQVYDLDAALQVGEVHETVEVQAAPVQVETTSIQQQTLINSQQIVDLPLNGRNFTQLEQLAPGVMASNDRFGTFSVNGSQSQQSNYLINGTDSNDIALNTPGFLPSPDAIQEFNLISSTINPEYGRNSGGIVNAVIKSGTNNFHGTVFDFYRDTFLNARNFFSGSTAPAFHQNQFGGTFGGPIKKDNTFFFLSYQGTYNKTGSSGNVTVFSPDQRNGFFPGLATSTATSPFPLVGENGTTFAAGTPYSTIFPTGHIPAVDFNPISSGLLAQFVPQPNAPGNRFQFSAPNTSSTDQGIAKIDHSFSNSDQIWGIYARNYNRAQQALPFTGATLPGFGTHSTANTQEVTLAYNHTFSSTALNEFRLGWHRLNFDAVEPNEIVDPSTFGFTNIVSSNPAAAQLPVIAVSGLFTLGFSDNGPQPRVDSNYQVTDNFSKVTGNHTFKFGFDGRRFQVDNPFNARVNGHFNFGANGEFTTGTSGADFLLGIPDSYAQFSTAVINARAYEYYGYGQDQWKMRNNLTITYGAGYQIDTPYNNTQFGGLAFNCIIPGQKSTIFPTAPTGLNFPGDTNCNNSGSTIKYGHIAPRVGFAYSPESGNKWLGWLGDGHKTSIRGGFGLYFNRYEEETALQNLGAPPFGIGSGGVGDIGGTPSFADPWADIAGRATLGNKFPFTPPAVGSNVDFGFFEPLVINTNSPTLSTPYAMNFNLNVQRELPANTVLSVGYVGSLGRHLYRAYEANPITLAGAAACAADPFCVGHRNLQHIFFPEHTVLGRNDAECGAINGDCFGGIGTQFTDGTSNYSSLQVNINKGMSHGLNLITSYTWSHSIDNGSGFENSGFGNRGTIPFPEFSFLNVGDSSQDARQRLVFGYVYAIPTIHTNANWAGYLLGGWRFTGITTFQTGFAGSLSDTNFRSLTCDGLTFYGCGDNPNQLFGITSLNPRTSRFSTCPVCSGTTVQTNYWFDPNAFGRQTIGTFGNTGRGTIHGPGILNSDLSLQKVTKITEGKSLELGIEGFNMFNHTQFNGPNLTVNSTSFGRITSAAAGRIMQMRLKFSF